MEEQIGPSLEMVCSLCRWSICYSDDNGASCEHPDRRGWSLPDTLIIPDWCPIVPKPKVKPVMLDEHKWRCPKCGSESSTLCYTSWETYIKHSEHCWCGAWFDWEGVA